MRSERQRIAARRVAAEIAELENEINEAEMADAQAALDARTLEEKDTVDVPVPTVEASRTARIRRSRKAKMASLRRKIRKAAMELGLEDPYDEEIEDETEVDNLTTFISQNRSKVNRLCHSTGNKRLSILVDNLDAFPATLKQMTGRNVVDLFYSIIENMK